MAPPHPTNTMDLGERYAQIEAALEDAVNAALLGKGVDPDMDVMVHEPVQRVIRQIASIMLSSAGVTVPHLLDSLAAANDADTIRSAALEVDRLTLRRCRKNVDLIQQILEEVDSLATAPRRSSYAWSTTAWAACVACASPTSSPRRVLASLA